MCSVSGRPRPVMNSLISSFDSPYSACSLAPTIAPPTGIRSRSAWDEGCTPPMSTLLPSRDVRIAMPSDPSDAKVKDATMEFAIWCGGRRSGTAKRKDRARCFWMKVWGGSLSRRCGGLASLIASAVAVLLMCWAAVFV